MGADRAGTVGQRPGALPPAGHAVLDRDAPRGVRRGTHDFTAYYGMLLDGLQLATSTASRTTRCSPAPDEEIPQRFAARRGGAGTKKVWREQLREWDETFKPAAIATHRELQSVDPDALSDDELVAYLARCRDHHAEMISQHMRFTAGAMIPIGDFLAHVGDWTGIAAGRAARADARRGAGVGRRVRRARAAHRRDRERPGGADAARLRRRPGRRCSTQLRALPGDVGAAVSGYLDLVGYRLLDGFDISGRYALELPDALLRAIRIAVDGRRRADGADVDDRDRRHPRAGARGAPRRVRRAARRGAPHVPPARRARRLQRHLGVGHHAPRRARRRSPARAPRAASTTPSTSSTPSFDEMCALVTGTGGPSADELAARFAVPRARTPPRRRRRPSAPPPPPPPDPSGLPPGVGAASCARSASRSARCSAAPRRSTRRTCCAVSPRAAASTKGRRGASPVPSEFDRIEQGDVLVTESTTEAFNILLPLLGAIVTDSGGLLSHSAIVAREYGIPGVVGTRDATERIADGTRVRVDGDAGEVTVLAVKRRSSRSPKAQRRRRVFGSKAVGLGDAIRAGLPVPPGVALSGRDRRGGRRGRRATRSRSVADGGPRRCRAPLAVRSSAVDEDGADASFAGQHLTLLNVPSVDDVPAALREIWWSANSDSAITYRQRVGLFTRPSVGVVVQSLLDPDAAGRDVHAEPDQRRRRAGDRGELGTRRGRRRRACVIPDTFRIDRAGTVLERTPGRQEDRDPRPRRRRHRRGDGRRRSCVEQLCLDDDQLAQLQRARRAVRGGLRPGAATSSGRSPTARSTCSSAARSHDRVVAASRGEPAPTAASDPVERARAVPLFAGLDRRTRSSRSPRLFKERRFAAGETVIRGGLGRRRVLRDRLGRGDGLDPRRGARDAGRGDYFGEIALIDEGARSATVTATTELVCHGLTYWEFRPLVQQNGAIGWKLLQSMAKMLRDAETAPPAAAP